ncbi:hypothetical protein [Actinokineospora terrae]|uniref:Uncharacterized protein n=1 Tax=Actinokineospora terrae TaxID=155974 RepID=A0A1H9T6D2_9PSEU|nr:hypothetical protein [Actinokineospora terrae]SER92721.1 hypothetical protein SAMN04487818_10692 [Actinokineospora terrae]
MDMSDTQALFPAPPTKAPDQASQVSDATLLDNIRSFVAPIARDAAAVTDDPRAVKVARDLSEVFADHAGLTGMTRTEVEHAMARRGHTDRALFDSRFDLFLKMGLIKPFLEKKSQSRYVLVPSGMVGLLVFERLGTRGGVEEMMLLLDRTRWLIETGEADRTTVAKHLKRCRQMLSVYAATLSRLITTASIGELMDEHRNHDPSRVEADVHLLNSLVTDRFNSDHELGELAFQLVKAELAYRHQVLAAVDRVLDQGGASLDFSVLTPEQYLSAALDGSLEELAMVAERLVVDPPGAWLDPGSVLDALDEFRPRRRVATRPPEPVGGAEVDPIAVMQEQHDRLARQRRLAIESRLANAESVELTGMLHDLGWPAAAVQLVDLLGVSADPEQPFIVRLGEELLADAEAPVTYLHPVVLYRTPSVEGEVRS